jgi:hypothetical protein
VLSELNFRVRRFGALLTVARVCVDNFDGVPVSVDEIQVIDKTGANPLVKRRLTAIILLAAMCASFPCRQAFADPSREYAVKAAFIFNFAQFTEWPDNAFASANSPFVIGVIGSDPFDGALEQVIVNKTLHDRPVVVKYIKSLDGIPDCSLLFVPASEETRLNDIFDKIASRPILTIGETERFPWMGGTIQFYLEDNKLRFEINPESVAKAQLRISSKLMKLAKIFKR